MPRKKQKRIVYGISGGGQAPKRKKHNGIKRTVQSWRFGEGLLMKAIAVVLHDEGLRGHGLEAAFGKLVPKWKTFFRKPISGNALSQRADKARRYPREFDAIAPHMATAKIIVSEGRPLGKRELRATAALAA
jgi:hypothetical protein